MADEAGIERILVVTAHPDDVDFSLAGTIAHWTAAGIEVVYCVVTNGDAGGFDQAVPREHIPAIRQAEQRAAAACVGVSDVRFLGYPDGALEVTVALRRDLTRVIRQIRPQRMVIQSPERNWIRIQASHPDHLAAGEAALRAVYPDARNPFAHPELLRDEGLAAWTVAQTWMTAVPPERVNHYVDVTDTFKHKLAALRAHESQTAHIEDLEGILRSWLAANGRRAGLEAGRLAEAFQVVHTS
jgi:LmbE family N-acetylglucosaminyl deacetylase